MNNMTYRLLLSVVGLLMFITWTLPQGNRISNTYTLTTENVATMTVQVIGGQGQALNTPRCEERGIGWYEGGASHQGREGSAQRLWDNRISDPTPRNVGLMMKMTHLLMKVQEILSYIRWEVLGRCTWKTRRSRIGIFKHIWSPKMQIRGTHINMASRAANPLRKSV